MKQNSSIFAPLILASSLFFGNLAHANLINLALYPTANSNQTFDENQRPNLAELNKNQTLAVYFLNGIFTSEVKSENNAIALFYRLKDEPEFADLIMNNQIRLRTLYNPTDAGLGDTNELFAQVSIQNQAMQATQKRIEDEKLAEKYDPADLQKVRHAIYQQEIFKANQMYLAQKYSFFNFIHKAGNRVIEHYQKLAEEVKRSLLADERVVIVAHSQGNYLVQGIYAHLLHDNAVKDLVKDRLFVVGVANVAGTTPTGSYLTNEDDSAVYVLHKMQGGSPMPANFKAKFANGYGLSGLSKSQKQNDFANHSFIETYLSARYDSQGKFVAHDPAIVEDTSAPQPIGIYQKLVNKVMAGVAFVFQN